MRILILGAGKMGSWLARSLQPVHDVRMTEEDDAVRKKADGLTFLNVPGDILSFSPDMVINAVSLQHTIAAFRDVIPQTGPECVLCDVASIKGDLGAYYAAAGRAFVSIHPMFGPTFATMESLAGENAVLITESNTSGKEFWKTFFAELGVNVFEYSFAEHDDMMAYSLTLPFVSSLVFSSCVTLKAVPGTTFRKHLDVAKGLLGEDDFLLSEILFNPRSLRQLETISGKLNYLHHIIAQRDSEEARKFLAGLRSNVTPLPERQK